MALMADLGLVGLEPAEIWEAAFPSEIAILSTACGADMPRILRLQACKVPAM